MRISWSSRYRELCVIPTGCFTFLHIRHTISTQLAPSVAVPLLTEHRLHTCAGGVRVHRKYLTDTFQAKLAVRTSNERRGPTESLGNSRCTVSKYHSFLDVQFGDSPTFRRNMSLLCSVSKSKSSKKLERSRWQAEILKFSFLSTVGQRRCLTPASWLFVSWLTLRTWRWRPYVSQKRRDFVELHRVTTEKKVLYIANRYEDLKSNIARNFQRETSPHHRYILGSCCGGQGHVFHRSHWICNQINERLFKGSGFISRSRND
jgi:hypothetical protein